MKFKNSDTHEEYDRSHPGLRSLLEFMDDWSKARGLPEMVVTDVGDDGDIGRSPRSWHRKTKLCAADLRSKHYTAEQFDQFVKKLKDVCGNDSDLWELITKPHGTAPHIHIARCDMNYTPRKARGNNGMETPTD